MDYFYTGSLKIFANPSAREKDVFLPSAFVDTTRKSETLESILRNLRLSVDGGKLDVEDAAQRYLDAVNATPTAAKNSMDMEILRHEPTTQYTVNTAKKLFVQNRLMPYYRAHRPSCQWAYPNYHSVNFFTGSYVPTGSAWLYPNVVTDAHPNGCYSPSGSFTFEFFINPRYGSKRGVFPAGTILHLSSTFALSLVTGSSTGADKESNGFRLLLQLSSSADVRPGLVTPSVGDGARAFLSDDNSLFRNRWHHVMVTWGTNRNDSGTGSFYVDGARKGTFVFPSSSILPPAPLERTLTSYAFSNQDANLFLSSTGFTALGPSFPGNGSQVSSVRFLMAKTGAPTGSAVAKIYALPGVWTTNTNLPVAAAIATSDAVDVSALGGSYAQTVFTFTGANQVALTNGGNFAVVVEYTGGNSVDRVLVGADNSASTYPGFNTRFSGSWGALGSEPVFELRSLADAPAALSLGNYYVGNNFLDGSQTLFFAADTAAREGVHEMNPTTGVSVPLSHSFGDQLNAELHDVSLREEYVPHGKALAMGRVYPKRAPRSLDNYLFYVPPFFVPGAPRLAEVNGAGGLLISPFHSLDEASKHPFSAPMSFGVAGRYNSLENFTRDFATGRFARVLNLTASLSLESTPGALTANDYLYGTSSVRLRNLNVLPCDDGNFRPNFDWLPPLDLADDPRFVDDLGVPDPSLISLKGMVTGSIYSSLYHQTGSMFDDVVRLTPESGSLRPGVVPSGLYAVHQRTQDATSNEVVFFDISNLFYGERIKPGSFVVSDLRLSGSNGRAQMRLQDDGNGGLFRADSFTRRASWNHVGNVFYEEGIVLIKSPALPFFGMEGFDIEFEGEKTVNAMKLNVLVDATSHNTSSNPSWSSSLSASFDANRDPENQKFVTISGVNFHDENLNVVMRAQLAQPVVKRPGDRYLIRVKYDF